MAKILDPDLLVRSSTALNLGTDGNIWIDTTAKTIGIAENGSLTSDGVAMQAVYSYLKEEWKDDAALIKFDFPMVSITAEQFELVNGWDFADQTTKDLIRDGGWALKDNSGVSQEEYMNVTSLGSFDDSVNDQAYYLQSAGGTPTNVVLNGEVNQAVKIYGDASHGDVDYRSYFQIFLREQGKTYDYYDLTVQQNISALTYKKYAMPLSNATDLKITESDANIDTNAPYTGMSITYNALGQSRNIGGSAYDFKIIIDGNNGTAEQIYEFVQRELRKTSDIDADADVKRGDTAEALLEFVGDTLKTKITTDGGVYIDNYNSSDTNRLVFVDDTGAERTYPFVAAGNIYFNDNLQNDASAKYWMFFTDAGGNQFGTSSAIIVQDNTPADITGLVSSQSNISFDFDYDGNTQGGRTAGTDAAVTIVANGLGTAQYVKATGTIVRSSSNNFSLVSALERNYSNP